MTSSTLDLVCLTIPKPIALLPLALRNPLSDSGPISILATSDNIIFESPWCLITTLLYSFNVFNFESSLMLISLWIDSKRPAPLSIFSLLIALITSITVKPLDAISSGSIHTLTEYFLSPPIVIDATPGCIDNLSTTFLSR